MNDPSYPRYQRGWVSWQHPGIFIPSTQANTKEKALNEMERATRILEIDDEIKRLDVKIQKHQRRQSELLKEKRESYPPVPANDTIEFYKETEIGRERYVAFRGKSGWWVTIGGTGRNASCSSWRTLVDFMRRDNTAEVKWTPLSISNGITATYTDGSR